MTLAIFTHTDCLAHDPGPPHPERPERLSAVLEAVATLELPDGSRRTAPVADRTALERVHAPAYLRRLAALIPAEGLWNLNSDTIVSPGSMLSALRAAGAAMAAVDAVCGGEVLQAFCAVRPPGHHAEIEHPLGFCLLNTLAIAARHSQAQHGISRVAIVDFDAHHGNGAQNIFWNDPSVLCASIHQWPFDLPAGGPDECGAHGTILNVPLAAGATGRELMAALVDEVLPRLQAFQPGLLLIAAGFDGHSDDPLTDLLFESDTFREVGQLLASFAARQCGGRIVASLEGGYDLAALRSSTQAFLKGLQDG